MATSVGTLVRVIGCGQLDRLEIAETGLENQPVSLLKHRRLDGKHPKVYIRKVLSLTKLKSFFTT